MKLTISKKGQFSRKSILISYTFLILVAAIALAYFSYFLLSSQSKSETIKKSTIVIQEEKIEELDNYQYHGKKIDPLISIGRSEPFQR